MTALLEVKDLTLRFGGLVAVNGVSFAVRAGEILAVIGPNGAGKTSLFNAVTGIYPPTSGQVMLAGNSMGLGLTRENAPRLLAWWSGWGLVAGLLAAVAVNLADVWQAAVVDLFLPPKPFPWGESLRTVARMLAPGMATLIPGFLGFVAGFAGAWSLWNGSRLGPERLARAGVGRTFQNIRLFRECSVLDNVLAGMHPHLISRWFDAAFLLPRYWQDRAEGRARAEEILTLVGLAERIDAPAGSLPYGHQRRLEIARALALRPSLLLLDEPAAGMNPTESRELLDLIRRIRDRGVTVLLIEHDMSVVMNLSDRIIVLHYGAKIAEGTPAEIRANGKVVEAYLGRQGESAVHPAVIPSSERRGRNVTRITEQP